MALNNQLLNRLCPELVTIAKRHGGRAHWFPRLLYYLKKNQKIAGPQNVIPRSNLYNWNFRIELSAFLNRIKEPLCFENLAGIFIHPSYGKTSDQKLEIDKDSYFKQHTTGNLFLNNFVSQYIRASFPRLPEEAIRDILKYLISANNLSTVATHLGMKDLILSSEYPPTKTILSDTFVTFIGGLLFNNGKSSLHALPCGLDKTIATKEVSIQPISNHVISMKNVYRAAGFILDFVCVQLISLDLFEFWIFNNAYSLLTSILEKDYYISHHNKETVLVEARLMRSSGLNTIFAVYVVGIYFNKQLYAQGTGETLATAIDQAARQGLKKRFGIPLTNMGNHLDFSKDRLLPTLIGFHSYEEWMKSSSLPNQSINDMTNQYVDISVNQEEIENIQYGDVIDQHISKRITTTNDDILYSKFL